MSKRESGQTERLNVRLTSEEMEKMKEFAAKDGVSISDWIRSRIPQKAAKVKAAEKNGTHKRTSRAKAVLTTPQQPESVSTPVLTDVRELVADPEVWTDL